MSDRSTKITPLGQRIQARAEELDLSLAEVARRIKCDATRIQAWKRGRSKPSSGNLTALAKVLRCSVEWLTSGEHAGEHERPMPAAWADFELTRDFVEAEPWQLAAIRAAALYIPPDRSATVDTFRSMLIAVRSAPPKS